MKLNLTLWQEALVRFEAELRDLKEERRRHRAPGESFDCEPFFLCRAEVTRLYCLRRFVKGKLHAIGKLRRVRSGHTGQRSDTQQVTDLASQEAQLRSVPGWMESFLLPQPAATEVRSTG